ncbi:MAG: glycosyltransferase family 2 protein [Gammaproteobacteria bacterium]|nr:glycosyltransferase family 2 protein [Gammaproteobacteria bacterium]
MILPEKNLTVHTVSVVTVNYNSSDYTVSCVREIIKQTDSQLNYNIIVVDNNSENDEYHKLSVLDEFDNVLVIRSRINLGFAGGNMFGLQYTQAKYYFFLNNDCLLLNDSISALHEFCESRNDAGMCSPQLYKKPGQAEPCFDYFPTLLSRFLGTGIFRLTHGKNYFPRKKIPEQPLAVEVLSGSQLFVRASVFDELGGLDTNLFLYCEEEDLAIRLNKAGYKAYVVPQAHNQHTGGASTQHSYDIRREFFISFLYFYRKHYGFIKTQLLKILLFLRQIKKGYKDPLSGKLALFILSGAHMKYSLRHKQKIKSAD